MPAAGIDAAAILEESPLATEKMYSNAGGVTLFGPGAVVPQPVVNVSNASTHRSNLDNSQLLPVI